MRSNKNDRDLLSFADDRYILEAERIADADSLREAEKREKRKTRNIAFKYIATAAACFVVVLGLAFVPRLPFWHTERQRGQRLLGPFPHRFREFNLFFSDQRFYIFIKLVVIH